MNTYNTALLILIFIPYEFTVIHVIQTLCCSPKIVAIIAIKNDLVENYDKEDKHLFYFFFNFLLPFFKYIQVFVAYHFLYLNLFISAAMNSYVLFESKTSAPCLHL